MPVGPFGDLHGIGHIGDVEAEAEGDGPESDRRPLVGAGTAAAAAPVAFTGSGDSGPDPGRNLRLERDVAPRGREVRRRRLVQLAGPDGLETLRVLGLTAAIEVAIRVMTLPRITGLLGISLDLTSPDPVGALRLPTPALSEAEVRRVRAVRRVMHRWPLGKGKCLRQSLVLGQLLRHRRPVLRLGVRGGSEVVGHAWLEVSGTAIGGDATFLPLLARPVSP